MNAKLSPKKRRYIISTFFLFACVPTFWFFYGVLFPKSDSAAEVLPIKEIKNTGETLPNFAISWGEDTSSSAVATTETQETTKKNSEIPPVDFPKIASSDWRMILVGPDHPLQKEIDTNLLTEVAPGEKLDKRIVSEYQKMKEAAAKEGITLSEVSGYRSVADQTAVFNEKFQRMKAQGMTDEQAKAATMTDMTEPGYSEHHTGLAMDIVDKDWLATNPAWILDESYGKTKGGQWLDAHAREYGFIIRYPANKTKVTKITYEPWHLRYVGSEVAAYMHKENLCLEEFVQEVKKWEDYDSQTLSQKN